MRIKIDDKWIDIGEHYKEYKPKIRSCIICKTMLDRKSLLCKVCEKEIDKKYAMQQMS